LRRIWASLKEDIGAKNIRFERITNAACKKAVMRYTMFGIP